VLKVLGEIKILLIYVSMSVTVDLQCSCVAESNLILMSAAFTLMQMISPLMDHNTMSSSRAFTSLTCWRTWTRLELPLTVSYR